MNKVTPIRTWKQDAILVGILAALVIVFLFVLLKPDLSQFLPEAVENPVNTTSNHVPNTKTKQTAPILTETATSNKKPETSPTTTTSGALQERYLRTSFRKGFISNNYPRWAIVAWNREGKYPILVDEIANLLVKTGIPNPLELFTGRFLKDGKPEEIMEGDESLIFELGLGKHIDYLVLAKSEEKFIPDDKYPNIKSVRTMIEVQVVALNPYEGATFIRANEVASGFNKQNATERAIKKVLDKVQAKLSAQLTD